MKSKITIFSALLATTLFAACAGDHHTGPGYDSTGALQATNPYRDTFKTTTSTGEATTLDNTGSGGAVLVKAKPAAAKEEEEVAKPDTTKK
jgi:hypothetical protein